MSQARDLVSQMDRSARVTAWLMKSGRGLPAPKTAKIVAVAASMQLALEHHGAILALAKSDRRASLLALLRSIYEAYVWSAWLLRVARDEHISALAHNRLTRGVERMVGDLDRAGVFEAPMLADMKPIIKRLDGFVHGGYQHLQYRIHRDRVEARYPNDLIVDALRFSDLFAIMTVLEWPAMTDDAEMGQQLYREARELLGFAD